MTGLRFAYSFLPIAGVIGAIFVMWDYDITEETASEVRKALADRQNATDS